MSEKHPLVKKALKQQHVDFIIALIISAVVTVFWIIYHSRTKEMFTRGDCISFTLRSLIGVYICFFVGRKSRDYLIATAAKKKEKALGTQKHEGL